MRHRYEVSEAMVGRIEREAQGRRERALARGGTRTVDFTIDAEVCGMLAEVATRLVFGLSLDPVFSHTPDGSTDLILPKSGRTVEVKSSPRDTGSLNLIVPPYQNPTDADIWIFAPRPSRTVIRVAGWIPGKLIRNKSDFGRGCGPQYYYPEGHLYSFRELHDEEVGADQIPLDL